jgi:predicted nucleic acid-binding protein
MTEGEQGALGPEIEPVVVDTVLFGALLAGASQRRRELLRRYRQYLTGRPIVLAFPTVAELRYGAYKDGWGEARLRDLESRLREVQVVMPDNDLVEVCARLRLACKQRGHALHDKIHDADRWIAATAIRYGIPLVSDDGIFCDVPELRLLQVARDDRASPV